MKHKYFSALNEEEAKKYIGKIMEFADRCHVQDKKKWVKGKFIAFTVPGYLFPFKKHKGSIWNFMRTCPETFKPEKRVFEKWINVYPCEKRYGCYNSREDADTAASSNRVACLHIKQEYEVKGL